jgi:hypothetical protein
MHVHMPNGNSEENHSVALRIRLFKYLLNVWRLSNAPAHYKTGTRYFQGLHGPIRLSLIPFSSPFQRRTERHAPIWRTDSPRIMKIRIKWFRSYVSLHWSAYARLGLPSESEFAHHISFKKNTQAEQKRKQTNTTSPSQFALCASLVRICYETWSFHCFQGNRRFRGFRDCFYYQTLVKWDRDGPWKKNGTTDSRGILH